MPEGPLSAIFDLSQLDHEPALVQPELAEDGGRPNAENERLAGEHELRKLVVRQGEKLVLGEAFESDFAPTSRFVHMFTTLPSARLAAPPVLLNFSLTTAVNRRILLIV